MAELIAYFSRAGENYVNGTIKHLKVGNTQIVADMIQRATGADIFRLVPQVSYCDDYNECINQAKEDQKRGARPELVEYPAGIDGYDVIYLGYPNYWGTMPMCVFTFLERFNFDAKTIRPFCTHEGSGMGRSVDDIRKLCPGATVEAGIAIRGTAAESAQSQIAEWLGL